MSKIKLTGSNSGYVEIASAADAGNLTLTLPTGGTALLSNVGNVFSGITTTGQLDINGSIDVSSTSVFNDDLTLTGASYNAVWDKSDNQLEFADNAKLSFGAPDIQIYHDSSDNISKIDNLTSNILQIRNLGNNKIVIKPQNSFPVELYFNNNKKIETTNTGAVVTGICTATSFSGSGEGLTYTSPLSHRNIVINGDMRVAQRATSASMSSSGNDIPACDRWNYNRNGPSATVAQVAEAPDGNGFKYSLKWTNTSPVGSISAGNALIFLYKIEGQDIRRLGYGHSSGKIATLSFYAKGSLAGKVGVSCRRDGRIFSANSDMTANTWQRHSIVIPVDASTGFSANDNENGWQFGICWGGGSNSTSGATNNWINFHNAYTAGFTAGQQGAYLTTNGSTFQITGVQLEIGSQATPFEHRSFGEELERCRRYYQVILDRSTDSGDDSGLGGTVYTSNGGVYVPIRFCPPMRTKPTAESSSNSNGFRTRHGDLVNFTSFTGFNTWSRHGGTLITSTAGNKVVGDYYWIETDQGAAKLAVSAEL